MNFVCNDDNTVVMDLDKIVLVEKMENGKARIFMLGGHTFEINATFQDLSTVLVYQDFLEGSEIEVELEDSN